MYLKNEFTAGMCDYYHSLAMEHYARYCEYNKIYNQVSKDNESFDILAHTINETNLYFSSWREKQKNAIIATVFEALAVEALINQYIVKTYGYQKFNKEYKNVSMWAKYKAIIKKNTGKGFEEYREVYQSFSKLITIRNKLVHSEPQIIDMYSEDMQEFIDSMSKIFCGEKNNVFNSIDEVMNTYSLLVTIIK